MASSTEDRLLAGVGLVEQSLSEHWELCGSDAVVVASAGFRNG